MVITGPGLDAALQVRADQLLFCLLPWPGKVGPPASRGRLQGCRPGLLTAVSPRWQHLVKHRAQVKGHLPLRLPPLQARAWLSPRLVSPLLPKLLTARAPAPLTQPP